jgi:hypothetical protein
LEGYNPVNPEIITQEAACLDTFQLNCGDIIYNMFILCLKKYYKQPFRL